MLTLMTVSVQTLDSSVCIHAAKMTGMMASTVSTSRVNRLEMRPSGVRSKNLTGARSTALSMSACRLHEARTRPLANAMLASRMKRPVAAQRGHAQGDRQASSGSNTRVRTPLRLWNSRFFSYFTEEFNTIFAEKKPQKLPYDSSP